MGIKDVERGGGDSTDEKAQYAKIVFAIVAYATCSSMMLIINKLAVTFLPAPSVVLFAQLLTSAVAIKGESDGSLHRTPTTGQPAASAHDSRVCSFDHTASHHRCLV